MSKTLHIGYFYYDLLNLYGDIGNIEILENRARRKGFDVKTHRISTNDSMSNPEYDNINIVFMGGGPDSSQKKVYDDLINNKAAFLKKYIDQGKVGLYICGSYQLLGDYYKSSDGTVIRGVGALDLYTEHFGETKPRCIGNTVAKLSNDIITDPVFDAGAFGTEIVGFENHGGRTYLDPALKPFALVKKGFGNNGEDKGEGVIFKNSFGTYFHGPILSKNPHFADFLIHKALALTKQEVSQLPKLDDTLVLTAYTASKKLKQ